MLQNKDFFFVLIARTKRTNTLCSSDTLELNCISLWGFFVTKNSCRIWRFSSLIIKADMLCMLPHNLCRFIRVLHHNTISHSLYFEKSFNSSHYWILIHNSLAVSVIRVMSNNIHTFQFAVSSIPLPVSVIQCQ